MKLIQRYYKRITIIFFVLILIISFQTFQQKFYIERFQLADNVAFFDLLRNQSYRWFIWLSIAISLPFIVKKDIKKEKSLLLFFKHFIIIAILVLFNIAIISLLQIFDAGQELTLEIFLNENFIFFLFQKAPMYTLGYLAISILLFFNFENQKLSVEVQELIEIKNSNEEAYQKLKENNTDKAKVLTIKIGNKRKVISIDEILWIEANDYCVIVHSQNKPSYSMRSSLKTLENKLDANFLRVHRKGIVNMSKVLEFKMSSNPMLILQNEDGVPVSKSKMKLVNSFIKN